VEASSEGCGSDRCLLLLGLIGVSVFGWSRLVASLNGNAFLVRLVAPDLGVECSSEPCGMTVGFIGWSQGMCGVLAPVGEVGEPWKTKKWCQENFRRREDGAISSFCTHGLVGGSDSGKGSGRQW
jgi:hypothetical protein